jgi:predicted  nucleic acid-binding Zn-ribbon protein
VPGGPHSRYPHDQAAGAAIDHDHDHDHDRHDDPRRAMTLELLLELQEHDTAIDRLRHRHETIPARAALADAQAAMTRVEAKMVEVRSTRDEVARDEQRLDDEASSLENRAVEAERRLYSGEIASPRELQALQADIEQLRRHRRTLEDRELEVMERREQLDAAVGALDDELTAARADLERHRADLAAAEAEIGAELGTETTAREQIAAKLDRDLVALYERCRAAAPGGVGAARLVGLTCQGCHLTIPSTEAERVRKAPEGTIAHCDNCGCILVPS